jgi:hypothetical protein
MKPPLLCNIAHFEKLMNWQSRASEAIGAFHSTTSPKFASHVDKGKPRGNLVKMIQTGADGPVMLPVRQTRGGDMNMSGESLLVVLLWVSLPAGWRANSCEEPASGSSATLSSDS